MPVPASTGELPSLVGLIGHPVAGNPTGPMLEATFAHHGLDWRYVSMDVLPERLAPAVAGLAALGFRGFHVTVPHKVAVVGHMDRLTEAAAPVSYTHLRAHETRHDLVCRLLLEKKKKN